MDVETLAAVVSMASKTTASAASRAEAAADRAEAALNGKYIVTTENNRIIIEEQETE